MGFKNIKPVNMLKKLLLLALISQVSACSNLGYYAQSASGQLDVINRTESIQAILERPDTNPGLRRRLQLVLQIRDFASHSIDLPDNDSYRSYADLERKYAVWNVFAAPPLSLEPVRWCFPFAGCVSYKGYFNEQDAKDFARELKKQGHDVYVAGISAYSTLGWFDDPMLNTIIHRHDPELAGLIFHELTHQKLYVQDDTEFNESLAMTVELEGTKRWLTAVSKTGKQQYRDFLNRKQRRARFVELVLETRNNLEKIYQSENTRQQKLQMKSDEIARTRKKYIALRAQWQGYAGYDNWFNKEINNAKLVSIGTYHRFVPAFKNLLAQKNSFREFFLAVEQLSRLEKAERHQALDKLVN
jgi:predicted aminopeptidase